MVLLWLQSDFVNPCFFNPYASQSEHTSIIFYLQGFSSSHLYGYVEKGRLPGNKINFQNGQVVCNTFLVEMKKSIDLDEHGNIWTHSYAELIQMRI